MFSVKGVLAGTAAVIVLYAAVSIFRIVRSMSEQKATGLAAVGGAALEQLLHPAFLLAAVVVFLTAAYWANR